FVSLSTYHIATSDIYTLSLHDALPISSCGWLSAHSSVYQNRRPSWVMPAMSEPDGWPILRPLSPRRLTAKLSVQISPLTGAALRSEEHTSELQSPDHLVCRLLLEKKKQ